MGVHISKTLRPEHKLSRLRFGVRRMATYMSVGACNSQDASAASRILCQAQFSKTQCSTQPHSGKRSYSMHARTLMTLSW